ncbi:hypothetical protein B9S64_30650 [Streptomyces sp. SM18]|nr:hypothetical protein B9S64_30650 [Streptomyces sp. SM18]
MRRPSLHRQLDSLAVTAYRHAGAPVDQLCSALAEHHPSDGHDDMSVLILRTPASTDESPSSDQSDCVAPEWETGYGGRPREMDAQCASGRCARPTHEWMP